MIPHLKGCWCERCLRIGREAAAAVDRAWHRGFALGAFCVLVGTMIGAAARYYLW